MLGILLTYHSFFEFLPYQIQNLKKYIQVPFKIYVIDNSLTPGQKYSNPDVSYLFCSNNGSPSDRHQSAINLGLKAAWNECDSFLIFDNDMIFVDDFREPPCCAYLPQRRGNWQYAWLNLLYFPKDDRLSSFDFVNCPETNERTDSGGSFGNYLRSGGSVQTIEILPSDDCMADYQTEYRKLCDRFGVSVWYDIFRINNTRVFHFRALSNWTKYPEEFQKQKKALILQHAMKEKEPAEPAYSYYT